MLLALSISGIFISLLFLYFAGRNFTSSIYLGGFFLILSIYGINQYALLYSKSVILVAVFCTNFTFLYYLIGPLLLFYIRSVINDNSRLRPRDLLHLIPMATYFIAELPYLLTSFSYKKEVATEIVDNAGFLFDYKATILSEWFGNSTLYLSRPLILLLYTFVCLAIFIRYLVNSESSSRFARQGFMTRWVSLLLGFLFLLVFSYFVLIFQTFILDFPQLFYTANVLQIISAIGLTGLMISPFFFPSILYGLPRYPESLLQKDTTGGNEDDPITEEKKESYLNLEENYLQSIRKKTESSMRNDQPFLLAGFNLQKFAEQVQLPPHHLAYFFKEIRKQSFNDYRNACRVDYAKQLIEEGKAADHTLEAIGLLSGFSSRITFFRAFKKTEGMAPSAFLEQTNEKSFSK